MNVEAARRLVAAGAEGVLMACNTSHKCYDQVARAVEVPVLHIADAAADRLTADRRKNVAVLGTRFTMTEPFVRSRIEASGINIVPIEDSWVREVDRIIFEELAVGRVVRDSQRKLKTLITELAKRKTQAVLLACTELVFAVEVRANVLPVYDTTAIHARAAVDWMLADEEEARAAA
jgi:aspartate racemase